MAAGVSEKERLVSTELVQETKRTSVKTYKPAANGQPSSTTYSGMTQRSGSRPVGWVVRMFSEEKLVRVQASAAEYERLGLNAEALVALRPKRPGAGPGR